jgi:hypothetical protein
MRLEFEAVDEKGQVRRGVLEAPSESEARETLLAETLFPKTVRDAGESPVTWKPRSRVVGAAAGAGRSPAFPGEIPSSASKVHTMMHHAGGTDTGLLGVGRDGVVYFQADKEGGPRLVFTAAGVETARLVGFPLRMLRVVLLDGGLCEFPAGFLFAGRVHVAARDALTVGLPRARGAGKNE